MSTIILSERHGGEVGEFIATWKGKKIKCYGTCWHEHTMEEFVGYMHDGGLADENGNKWWVYYECPMCNYGHSFAKMDWFARRVS